MTDKKELSLRFYRRIAFVLSPSERKAIGPLVGLTLIGMALEVVGVGVVLPALALLVQDGAGPAYQGLQPVLRWLGNPSREELVVRAMLTLTLVFLLKNSYLAFLGWAQTKFVADVQADLSQRLFEAYLRQPYVFHLRRNSAQLIRNVTTEVSLFAGVLTHSLLVGTEALVVAGVSVLLLFVEPLGATSVVVLIGGAAWAFHHATRHRIGSWGLERQYHDGLRFQHLQQGLGGVKIVKLLGRETGFLAEYQVHNERSAKVTQYLTALQKLPRLWLEMLVVIGMALVVGSILVQQRSAAAIVPLLGLFGVAAFRLMPAVTRVLGGVQGLRFGAPVVDILAGEFACAQESDHTAVCPMGGERPFGETLRSELRGVDIVLRYDGQPQPALNGLSVVVRRGESVGFIGKSGSGKSTLVDVLLGLLTPQHGRVMVDGKDIREDLRQWQRQVGLVPQEIFLTDDTIRRNVAFGLPESEIDDGAVWKALQAAQLEEFLNNLPDSLDTVVGERGVRLSGGQRQRIGMARALYHDPSVLVLDEATSSLDTVTEREVMQAVASLQGAKTTIIVAHRLSTVARCDRIYRLDQGRVVDEGPPAHVLPVIT
ncbi:MAG: ABC transporter ATP-binding protein [Bacillota bacterium]|nr:ABC transporter ATP-binding protein [Bacillota bacterium]